MDLSRTKLEALIYLETNGIFYSFTILADVKTPSENVILTT